MPAAAFPYRHRRRRAALSGVLAAGSLAVGVAIGWLVDLPLKPLPMPFLPGPTATSPAPSGASTLDAGALLAPTQRDALAVLLLARNDFANDLLFLFAASLRDRCNPAHAHELARMAVAARLPVLDGAMLALQRVPELRGAVYALVRRLAATAPCGRPLDLVIGRYRARLDPERYAAAFPDSYFAPDLDTPPADIADRGLRDRTADPCTPIIYAVLPLDAERAWECQGLRVMLRRRLVQTCAAGMHEAPATRTAQLAASIHDDLKKLPAMCQ